MHSLSTLIQRSSACTMADRHQRLPVVGAQPQQHPPDPVPLGDSGSRVGYDVARQHVEESAPSLVHGRNSATSQHALRKM